MVLSRDYFTMEYQVEKLNSVLIILDMLEAHNIKVNDEIEIIEMLQDRILRKIENRKEAKKK